MLDGTRVNARWFGATGDGSTNDTTTLQNAINYCQSTGLGLYVSKGTYIVSAVNAATFCLTTNTNGFFMESDGYDSEIKLAPNTQNAGLLILQANSGQIQNCTVQNVRFNGNKANQVSSGGAWSSFGVTVFCDVFAGVPANVTLNGLFCHSAYHNIAAEGGGIRLLGNDFSYALTDFPA